MLASSCSDSYDLRFAVQLAHDVEIPVGATIGFVVIEHSNTRMDPADPTTWSARVQVPANQGMRSYQGKANECCAPNPVVSLHAFVDIDGDRRLDPDEPRGSDPAGPVTLGKDGKEYRASIVITRAN